MSMTHGGVPPTRHDCSCAVFGSYRALARQSVMGGARCRESWAVGVPWVPTESTKSPHSIALQGTTVRNSVEEKRPLTCDNVQNAWSAKPRVLLCKQGVVGSSPIVSTDKVLVRGYFRPSGRYTPPGESAIVRTGDVGVG